MLPTGHGSLPGLNGYDVRDIRPAPFILDGLGMKMDLTVVVMKLNAFRFLMEDQRFGSPCFVQGESPCLSLARDGPQSIN